MSKLRYEDKINIYQESLLLFIFCRFIIYKRGKIGIFNKMSKKCIFCNKKHIFH